MRKVKWSEIDIEDELRRLEALLSTSLYMNFDDETEYSVAMDLISMSLSRVSRRRTAAKSFWGQLKSGATFCPQSCPQNARMATDDSERKRTKKKPLSVDS